jgi:methylmalonyl-CoA mutase cobalamin-binding subunit
MATALVRSFVSTIRPGSHGESARRMLVSTPAGQQHELGALMAAATADEAGWDVVYLGPDLPAEEIAAASRQLNVDAVALSVIYSGHDRRMLDEIRRVRQYLDAAVPLYVGGRAATDLGSGLQSDGIHIVVDLDEFQRLLGVLQN